MGRKPVISGIGETSFRAKKVGPPSVKSQIVASIDTRPELGATPDHLEKLNKYYLSSVYISSPVLTTFTTPRDFVLSFVFLYHSRYSSHLGSSLDNSISLFFILLSLKMVCHPLSLSRSLPLSLQL